MIAHKIAATFFRNCDSRLLAKAARLMALNGYLAMREHKKRLKRGECFPPFLLISLTNACDLACHGCWIDREKGENMPPETLRSILDSARKAKAKYFTLLGGEPFLYPHLLDIIESYPDCYFQVITSGRHVTRDDAACLAAAGNVTPLVSIDGPKRWNDSRRGDGVFDDALRALRLFRERKLITGVATTVTASNFKAVMTEDWIRELQKEGVSYLWYYFFRPMGGASSLSDCLSEDLLFEGRKTILSLRRKSPLLIVDAYWDAEGNAVCPATRKLGFHINPDGSLNFCPPLPFSTEKITAGGDIAKLAKESVFLEECRKFALEKTPGCVILEDPKGLADKIGELKACEANTGGALDDLRQLSPKSSHHLPGREQPEDLWIYRTFKKNMFFGMSAMG